MLVTDIFSFSHCFPVHHKQISSVWATFELKSGNALEFLFFLLNLHIFVKYSMTYIQRPPKGSSKSGLLQ